MPRYALETIAASATAPGAGGAAMSAVAGDSLRIRDSGKAWMLDVMTNYQVSGFCRITSPLLHDNVVGITKRAPVNVDAKAYLSLPIAQPLTPQDTLTMFATGSAVAGDVELAALQIYYEDLAGIDANLISPEDLRKRAVELFVPRISVAPTASGWSGNTPITALDDQLKANDEYAWVGCGLSQISASTLAVGLTSPDWGNVRIGCPISVTDYIQCESYFIHLSMKHEIPLIPVFNASQKDNVVMNILNNEVLTTLLAHLNLVRLRPRGKK